jgi:hypothetical protein
MSDEKFGAEETGVDRRGLLVRVPSSPVWRASA